MSLKLSGLRVLVTRPTPQHQSICSAIQEQGGSAIHFPLIEIAALESENEIRLSKSKVQILDNYQVLIFVSNNAVKFGANLINNYWPQFPLGVEVIAIGKSTASKIATELNCKAIHPSQGASSEDVLAMSELDSVADKKIAIIRGKGGRELLAETLRARGAEVDYLEVYRRSPANNTSSELKTLIETEQINVYSVTSGESLERLYFLLTEGEGERDEEGKAKASKAKEPSLSQPLCQPLIVPSERIAAAAQDFGFTNVQIALGADVQATINALQELAN